MRSGGKALILSIKDWVFAFMTYLFFTSSAFGNQPGETVDQRWKVIVDDSPDQIEPNITVAMDKAVAHARYLTPWNVWMCRDGTGRDAPGSLTNHFKRSNDGILM